MPALPTPLRRDPGLHSPWRDFDLLEDRMQRLMRILPLRETGAEMFEWAPRVDFSEEDGRYVLTAELPGIEPEDVEIEIEGNVLSMKGQKALKREEEGERIRLSERRYGAFERSFTLPATADPEKIRADFRQGVLTVQIEKRPEARGKKITVQAH